MSDTDTKPPAPPNKRRRLRILGLATGVLTILIVTIYFSVTSSAFIKGVLLPRLSRTLQADITVREVSIHPFSEIRVQDLKIQSKGQEPLIVAPEVHVRYSLLDILRGHIHVDEASLVSPVAHVIENPDGTSNLDPFLSTQKKAGSPEKKTASASRSGHAPQFDVQKVALSHATIIKVKRFGGGYSELVELTNINLTLDQFQNGKPGKLTVAAGIRISNRPPAPDPGGTMEATVKGGFAFSLLSDLIPSNVKGEARLDVSRATGQFDDVSALSVVLNSEVTPKEIHELGLRFTKGGTALGELAVRGPLDMEKLEGRLLVELRGVDRRVLNLVGAASDIDFGTTTLNSTNEISLAKSGSLISARGHFQADRIQLTYDRQTTPSLDLGADYDVTLDRNAQTAVLRRVNAAGTQNGNPLLSAQLSQPMSLAWGNGARPIAESSLDLTVSSLNLSDWRAFLGNSVQAGAVDLKLKLSSRGGGKQLYFDLESQSRNLTIDLGDQRTLPAAVSLQAQGQAGDLKHVTLARCQVQVTRGDRPVANAAASGNLDLAANTADVQVALQASLAGLFQCLQQVGLNASGGTLDLTGRFTQKQKTCALTGDLNVKQWTGQSGNNRFNAFGAGMDFDVSLTPEKIQINKATGRLSQAGNAGGGFGLSGFYSPATETLQVAVTLSGLNQNSLKPFLDPLLAGKRLATVTVNGDASLRYIPKRDSAIKASLQVTDLAVTGPQSSPSTPLEAKLQLDATIEKQTAEVRQFQVALTPTSRAKNQVQLEGRVDFSRTNAIQGNVRLVADSLDVTRYYDLFVGNKPGATRPGSPAASQTSLASASSGSNEEPPAIKWPYHNCVAEVDIGQFYLHEIEIRNWQTTVKLDGGHVLLQPCQLTLNGSPVNATLDADLGIPGWKYRVSLGANRVPVRPIADSLLPNARGQYNGYFTAGGQLQGAGFTGTSLKKNLNGGFSLDLTNANIQVIASRTKFFLIPININLIATLLNVPEITRSPVTGANVKVNVGKGRIDLEQATVSSPAFLANVHGVIPIADVFTNSPLNLPVEISLTNSLARKLTFPGGRPPTADYVPLPGFLTVTGTIGQPESRKNGAVLTAMTIGAAAGLADSAVGSVIKGGGTVANSIGGIINGVLGNPGTSTGTQTNQPASHPSGIGGFLDHLIPK
jgi:hypothetical protein